MAKKVLNNTHRNALYRLARELVRETQPSEQLNSTYNAAADMVAGLVEKRYPKADMEVLKKYQAGRTDHCIFVSPGYGSYEQFTFRDDDDRAPYIARRFCNSQTPHLMDEAQAELFFAWQKADEEHSQSIRNRIRDFDTLIKSARTFEDLVEVWPAADRLRERICGHSTAVSLMSEDVLARIKADPAALGANHAAN